MSDEETDRFIAELRGEAGQHYWQRLTDHERTTVYTSDSAEAWKLGYMVALIRCGWQPEGWKS